MKLVKHIPMNLRWRFPLKCQMCPEPINKVPYVSCERGGGHNTGRKSNWARYYHLKCYPANSRPKPKSQRI